MDTSRSSTTPSSPVSTRRRTSGRFSPYGADPVAGPTSPTPPTLKKSARALGRAYKAFCDPSSGEASAVEGPTALPGRYTLAAFEFWSLEKAPRGRELDYCATTGIVRVWGRVYNHIGVELGCFIDTDIAACLGGVLDGAGELGGELNEGWNATKGARKILPYLRNVSGLEALCCSRRAELTLYCHQTQGSIPLRLVPSKTTASPLFVEGHDYRIPPSKRIQISTSAGKTASLASAALSTRAARNGSRLSEPASRRSTWTSCASSPNRAGSRGRRSGSWSACSAKGLPLALCDNRASFKRPFRGQ